MRKRTMIGLIALAVFALVGIGLLVFGGRGQTPEQSPTEALTAGFTVAPISPGERPGTPETAGTPAGSNGLEEVRPPWHTDTRYPAGEELDRIPGSSLPATNDYGVFGAALVNELYGTDYRSAGLDVREERLASLRAACAPTFGEVTVEQAGEMCDYALDALVWPEAVWTRLQNIAQVEFVEVTSVESLDRVRYLRPMGDYANPILNSYRAGVIAADISYRQSMTWIDQDTGGQVPEMLYEDALGVILLCPPDGQSSCSLITAIPGGLKSMERDY